MAAIGFDKRKVSPFIIEFIVLTGFTSQHAGFVILQTWDTHFRSLPHDPAAPVSFAA
jgi:hypothetical protein